MADTKISADSNLASPASGDLIPIVDIDVADSLKNKTITWSQITALITNSTLNFYTTGTGKFDSTLTVANTTLTTDDTFYLGAASATVPQIVFDTNDSLQYDRSNNTFSLIIGSTSYWRVDSTHQWSDVPLFIKEQASASADTAAYGQIWVKNTTPNQLWFTDDAGTDVQLGVGGGALDYSSRHNPQATTSLAIAGLKGYLDSISSIYRSSYNVNNLYTGTYDTVLSLSGEGEVTFLAFANTTANYTVYVKITIDGTQWLDDLIMTASDDDTGIVYVGDFATTGGSNGISFDVVKFSTSFLIEMGASSTAGQTVYTYISYNLRA